MTLNTGSITLHYEQAGSGRPLILLHGKESVVITCDPDNWASRKTCIRLGCELERTVDVPRRIQTRWLISERKCRYIWRMNSRMDIE